MEENIGFIYIATNEAMPNLCKIGCSGREELNKRLDELYGTNVPYPFKCEYAGEVENYEDVEEKIHEKFKKLRVNLNREFFEITHDIVVPWIKDNFTINDVTEDINQALSNIDKDAYKQYQEIKRTPRKYCNKTYGKKTCFNNINDRNERKKRPRFDFKKMGIKNGEIITFINDERIKVKVAPDNYVVYRREECRLSELTAELLGSNNERVDPKRYWEYKGKSLQERYNKTYGEKS